MKCVCCGSKNVSLPDERKREEVDSSLENEDQGCTDCGCTNFNKHSSRKEKRKKKVTKL